MILKRKAYNDLVDWKKSNEYKKTALVVKGLRQVGKTTLVKQFCKNNYENIIYINFVESKNIKKVFDGDLNVDILIRNISAFFPKANFIPFKTVLIFDELQECARARTSLKFFAEDKRFDVIATGSLLGLRGYNKKEEVDIPVGFETFVDLYPLDFEEYLWAKGYSNDVIEYMKDCFIKKIKIADSINSTFMNTFKEYLCVGGMPEAVVRFLNTNNFMEVSRYHHRLLEQFKDDFGKHLDKREETITSKVELKRILQVYDSIPAQVRRENGKFQYSLITKNAKSREYRDAISWLEEYGLIRLCYNIKKIELPLEGNKDLDSFKIFVTDTGLLCSMLDDENIYNEILFDNLGIYKGAIYENIIAEQFIKLGKKLYYYSDNSYEVDFMTTVSKKLSLIEVKAKNNRARSLNQIISKNNKLDSNYKLIDGNLGKNEYVTTLPLYMAFLLR